MGTPGGLLGAPGLPPGGPEHQAGQRFRARLGVGLWGFGLFLLPPLRALVAQRLGVHGHEERAVGRFAFDVHERKLGDGRFQRILGVRVSQPLLIVFLPLLVLVLDKFKVIIYQVYFFG